MKIKTSSPYPGYYVAIDDDSYDGPGGPDEKGSPCGSGRTPEEAINDLVGSIVDDLEDKILLQRVELKALRAENKAHQEASK